MPTTKPMLLLTVLASILTVLWVRNCSGPLPIVAGLEIVPPGEPNAPYLLRAEVRNEGSGHGEVEVVFRLRDRRTGRTVEHSSSVELEPGEDTLVVGEIAAPPGDYEPEVEVDYPPR